MVSCLGVGRIRGFRVEGEGSDTGVSCLGGGGEGYGGFVSGRGRRGGFRVCGAKGEWGEE